MKIVSRLSVLTILAASICLVPSIAGAVATNIGSYSFLKGTPAEYFNDEDFSIFESTIFSTLDNAKDGASNTWENPKNHNSGKITVLRTVKNQDLDCRLLQIANQAKNRKRVTKQIFCKQPDGQWKVTSPKELEK